MPGCKNWKSLGRILLLALAGLVLGLGVYNWNARKILGNQMPMPFGFGVSVVLSGSMEPALRVDDLVIVREPGEIAEGDIVVFQSGKSLVIHRITHIDGDSVTTKGDANNTEDKPIARGDIRGVLVTRIPGMGGLVRFLRKPAVVIVLLAAALGLMESSYRKEKQTGSSELEALRQEIRKMKEELKEK